MKIRDIISEEASAGATSAGNIATVVNPNIARQKIKRDRNGIPKAPQALNPNGTAKNALDIDANITGGPMFKR
jgi:hypothetical protein